MVSLGSLRIFPQVFNVSKDCSYRKEFEKVGEKKGLVNTFSVKHIYCKTYHDCNPNSQTLNALNPQIHWCLIRQDAPPAPALIPQREWKDVTTFILKCNYDINLCHQWIRVQLASRGSLFKRWKSKTAFSLESWEGLVWRSKMTFELIGTLYFSNMAGS